MPTPRSLGRWCGGLASGIAAVGILALVSRLFPGSFGSRTGDAILPTLSSPAELPDGLLERARDPARARRAAPARHGCRRAQGSCARCSDRRVAHTRRRDLLDVVSRGRCHSCDRCACAACGGAATLARRRSLGSFRSRCRDGRRRRRVPTCAHGRRTVAATPSRKVARPRLRWSSSRLRWVPVGSCSSVSDAACRPPRPTWDERRPQSASLQSGSRSSSPIRSPVSSRFAPPPVGVSARSRRPDRVSSPQCQRERALAVLGRRISEFRSSPLHGRGAGSFESWWAAHGALPTFVRNAHSLYLEVLGELGLVGLVPVGGVCRYGSCSRRATRSPHPDAGAAALLAAAVGFLLAAGIDWMWQLTAVGAVGVLCLGLLTGSGSTRGPRPAASSSASHASQSPHSAPWRSSSRRRPCSRNCTSTTARSAAAAGRLNAAATDARRAQFCSPGRPRRCSNSRSSRNRRAICEGACLRARSARP